jgi:predicted phosphodiesterase
MRVAVVSDVHGNLPALEAVLAEVEREGVDLVVSGGDVAMGPMPAQCVDALLALDRVLWVRGNADREAVPERYEELARWVGERLGRERRQLLVDAPLTARADVDGLGPVLFFHGTPRSDEEILTKVSPEHRVAEVLDGIEERVAVHGHTHVQYDREVAGRRVVNAGSVGIPYEGRQGAFWALLGPDVELRRAEYDVDAAVAAIRATGYPGVDELAGWLLEPPDPDEISAFFEGHATGA